MFYDVFFFVVNFPLSIYYILYDVNLARFDTDPVLKAQFNMIHAVIVNLSYYEQTLTLFFYFGFNRIYRRELIRVLRGLFFTSPPGERRTTSVPKFVVQPVCQ